ncbi:MAG: multiple sugar transport system ATP-binding protein [Mariniblastus sp.]|jgi:multiple sugar transport system ATP-binding protein
MANVILESLTKRFPDSTLAVNRVSLEVKDQEFLVLVGPSGCGKSTTLRLIAGLETSTGGKVEIGGRDVTHVAPNDRDLAMVFQSFALYPHLSVYKNMSFGLTLRLNSRFGGGMLGRGLSKIFQPQRAAEYVRLRAEIDKQIRQTALRLGIEELLDRKPHQLSGGERQRVAFGRAIVRNPAVFLFDEPLSNLDANLRQQMRVELKRIHRDLKATMIYVTHDQVEAMTLGDRVAVMNEGVILQVGRPLEIYQQPANLFVATLMGSMPLNRCRGIVKQDNDWIEFQGDLRIRWPNKAPLREACQRLFRSGETQRDVVIGIRPEHVVSWGETTHEECESGGGIEVVVTQVDRLGESTLVHSRVCGTSVCEIDDNLKKIDLSQGMILARLDSSIGLEEQDRVRLKIELAKVLWFDPESGENLLKERT